MGWSSSTLRISLGLPETHIDRQKGKPNGSNRRVGTAGTPNLRGSLRFTAWGYLDG
jgi:hypothetical protein